MVKEIKIYN